MMNKELVKQLHELADWIEKHNNVHCHSVPRKAAYAITILEKENIELRLRLNKREITLTGYLNRTIGLFRFFIYKIKKSA